MKRIILIIVSAFYFSCSNYEGIDITKPSASINSPSSGEYVSDMLMVIAAGFDDIEVDYLELWVNNINTGLTDDDQPYEFYIDTHIYEDGTELEIAVRAYDTSENESQLSIPVVVIVDNNYPTPVIFNPIILENDTLHFSWSKCRDGDFYGYVIMNGVSDSSFSDYTVVDTIFGNTSVDRKVVQPVTSNEEDFYFSINTVDSKLKSSRSNAVKPVSFDYHPIASGEFYFGEENEVVYLQNSYQIMTTEVTNLQFSEFLNVANQLGELDNQIGPWVADFEGNILYNLDEGKINWNGFSFSPYYDLDSARDYSNHPATFVSWYGAKKFAEFFEFRLPTEKEWEKAARADNNWDYPWGNYLDSISYANYLNSDDPYEPESDSDTGTTPVAYYISYGGLYDMAGNVWEWVTRDEDLYVSERMYRGGSWKSPKQDLRCWINNRFLEPHMMGNHIGFRCVK